MSLTINISVVPGSGKCLCILDKQGKLKCYLKNQAEKGKANKELLVFFAKSLGVAQEKVKIIQGLTSRKKRLTIDLNITFEQFLQSIGIDSQIQMFG